MENEDKKEIRTSAHLSLNDLKDLVSFSEWTMKALPHRFGKDNLPSHNQMKILIEQIEKVVIPKLSSLKHDISLWIISARKLKERIDVLSKE